MGNVLLIRNLREASEGVLAFLGGSRGGDFLEMVQDPHNAVGKD